MQLVQTCERHAQTLSALEVRESSVVEVELHSDHSVAVDEPTRVRLRLTAMPQHAFVTQTPALVINS